jgi:glucose-6-phosphate isomerase
LREDNLDEIDGTIQTVNTSSEPFSFLAIWPGDAGHDYGTIEQQGFAKLLVDRDGQAAFIDNPQYAGPFE